MTGVEEDGVCEKGADESIIWLTTIGLFVTRCGGPRGENAARKRASPLLLLGFEFFPSCVEAGDFELGGFDFFAGVGEAGAVG